MLDKKYLAKVRENLLTYSEKRREVIKLSGDAQHLSKKAIFALQRDDFSGAEDCLARAKNIITELNKSYKKDAGLFGEGSYRAALEEYTESKLFSLFVAGKTIGAIKDFEIDSDIFIGGLSDVVGEILRYAIKSATEKKFSEVERCFAEAEAIVSEMVDMNLTGYNRQKFDQAKQALNKLEQVRYEVSLRK
jgi:predicted translin family RNA/ssDNA-binding protein